jgi:hypothetical protein
VLVAAKERKVEFLPPGGEGLLCAPAAWGPAMVKLAFNPPPDAPTLVWGALDFSGIRGLPPRCIVSVEAWERKQRLRRHRASKAHSEKG